VRTLFGLIAVAACAWGSQVTATVEEQTHQSQVMGGARTYRVFLPASYKATSKRFPVIYWLHGYEAPDESRERALREFIGGHDVILVDSGPADLTGNFPLYFPELVEYVDRTLRTVADRAHRAVTGYGAGGFLAMWEASRSADLVGSASSLQAEREAEAGPTDFPVIFSMDDLHPTSVKTWTINGSIDLAAMLEFHMKAFADPLPKPETFTQADPYPNFGVWNWEVASSRRSPGFTVLENVSRAGFRSAVREWLPSGAPVASVKVSITSARLYPPNAPQTVTYVHVTDGKVRHASQRADAQGRLTFEVDGDEYEVGVGAGPVLAAAGFTTLDDAWATMGQPVKLKVNFLNKGAVRSTTETVKWESSVVGVKFENATGRLFGLAPGESAGTPVTFTLTGPPRSSVQVAAVTASGRVTIDVPLFPPAEPTTDFVIADGASVDGYPHELGEGNRDGHASPGETVAILVKGDGAMRATEIFTNDPCIDNSIRIAEGGRKYSLPKVKASCEPGHVVHALARAGLRYASIEFPVWYKQ
jgi:hypothetical protein